jgi:hypothetical protein
MAADHRVRAGVDLDGALAPGLPVNGLDGRPFLLIGNPANHGAGGDETSWATDWPQLDGWKRWLTITGTTHLNFTDVPLLGDQLGLPTPGAQIDSTRALQITRDYVAAFFDEQLKGRPQTLFDGPSAAYPEVVNQRPAG